MWCTTSLSDTGEQQLWRCFRANRHATVEQLSTQMNQAATISDSSETIQQTMFRMGLRSRCLLNAPFLTDVHRWQRLKFALYHHNWTFLCSDKWLSQMNYVLCCIGQMDVGVYGVKCVKDNTLYKLPEGFELEERTLWSGEYFFSPQNDGIYQQDSARCYTSRSVCAGFEERQDEFTIFPWPVKLPDLNQSWIYIRPPRLGLLRHGSSIA